MQSSVRITKFKFVLFLFMVSFLIANPYSADAAFNARLQGQSRGSTAWIGGNLQGWRDLDLVPCRVYLSGGPANNKTVVVEFDRMQGRNPGIDDLLDFTPSANVVLLSAPRLSAPVGSGRWSYTFTVKLLDGKPGWVRYNARLALGAHLNGGSSVAMRGSPSLGSLQIHKIGAACCKADLSVVKTGPAETAPGDVIIYTLQYSNKLSSPTKSITTRLTDTLPPHVTVVADSIGTGRISGNSILWDLPNLKPGDAGTISFKVTVNTDVTNGQTLTNSACLTNACPDPNPANNKSRVITRIIFNSNRPPIANPDTHTGTRNTTLIVPAPGVLANDTDPDGDPLSAILVTSPSHGWVTLNADGSFQYVPRNNFSGTDTFAYKANDGEADSQPAIVTILVAQTENLPPTVTLVNPTNGAIYIQGMDFPLVAEAVDVDGTISRVDFFTGSVLLGTTVEPSYTLLLTNVGAGEYVFHAGATDNDGALALSVPVSITVLEHPPYAAGPFILNRQTGLFEQTVMIVNPTPLALNGIRLWILDIRTGASVWNPTTVLEGVPCIDVFGTISPGSSIKVVVEYYTPDVRMPPEPRFLPEVL